MKLVAEIGRNHNGCVATAEALISTAVEHGITLVKFQKRDIDLVYKQEYLDRPLKSEYGTTVRDQKAGLELSLEAFERIDKHCSKLGAKWFVSVWDVNSCKQMAEFDIPYIKIPSACLIYDDLLECARESGKPVILSTGMSTKEEVFHAIKVLGDSLDTVMYCVSSYPTPDRDIHFKGFIKFADYFKSNGFNVGYSSHSPNRLYPVIASMFADIVEFHITLNKNMAGSDHRSSLDPADIKMLMLEVNKLQIAAGEMKWGFIKPSEEYQIARLRGCRP